MLVQHLVCPAIQLIQIAKPALFLRMEISNALPVKQVLTFIKVPVQPTAQTQYIQQPIQISVRVVQVTASHVLQLLPVPLAQQVKLSAMVTACLLVLQVNI